MTMEYALIFRERYQHEQGHVSHFTLQAGSKEWVDEPGTSQASNSESQMSPEAFQGYLVRPGIDVRTGQRVFYIKLRDPQQGELPSIKADTPADALQKLIEQGKQNFAEKAPTQPVQQQSTPARPAGPRIRPGSLR